MANAEHLKILEGGVAVWNRWRQEHPQISPDLREASLIRANFRDANFFQADLTNADLRYADLVRANLFSADLSSANLVGAELSGASLDEATLCEANLFGANFNGANLNYADLTKARINWTSFGNLDLSNVKGLEKVTHEGPSTIGMDTVQKSKGKISVKFLRGCGLRDWEIESAKLYNPGLGNHEIDEILYKVHDLRAKQPIQVSPLFISYSHADSAFVDKMEEHLNAKGIRFWRDMHHATAGRLEKQIDRAIRHNPTVLLVLSESSIKSDWVEHEVRTARELEKESGRDVFCPVALDDSWKSNPWPKRVVEQVMEYNILDFSDWKDDTKFEKLFRKLIDGLELFYRV
jgi:uncharacterized protein YjbI with pentapeptide repeats